MGHRISVILTLSVGNIDMWVAPKLTQANLNNQHLKHEPITLQHLFKQMLLIKYKNFCNSNCVLTKHNKKKRFFLETSKSETAIWIQESTLRESKHPLLSWLEVAGGQPLFDLIKVKFPLTELQMSTKHWVLRLNFFSGCKLKYQVKLCKYFSSSLATGKSPI